VVELAVAFPELLEAVGMDFERGGLGRTSEAVVVFVDPYLTCSWRYP
jgi:hypothetical protein